MKATIIITDNPDGTIDMTSEFDPPIETDRPTPAAVLAFALGEHAVRLAGSIGSVEIDGE